MDGGTGNPAAPTIQGAEHAPVNLAPGTSPVSEPPSVRHPNPVMPSSTMVAPRSQTRPFSHTTLSGLANTTKPCGCWAKVTGARRQDRSALIGKRGTPSDRQDRGARRRPGFDVIWVGPP